MIFPCCFIVEFRVFCYTEDQGVVRSMLLNDNKAGMDGLDKDRINQIIIKASKGKNRGVKTRGGFKIYAIEERSG